MRITGCIITKHEEKTLEKCIKSMEGLINQLVVVDTGSCDSTVEIAKEHNAEVYYQAWKDDFSQARNYALDQALGDWIVFLDADEYLQIENEEFRKLLVLEERDALLCSLQNLIGLGENENFCRQGVIRIFRNSVNIRYQRAIHEYLAHSERELTWADYRHEVTVFHSGYGKDNIIEKEKVQRNIRLLLKEIKKDPGDGEINFYLADMYRLVQEWEKALFHLEIALEQDRFRREIFRLSAHVSKVFIMMESGRFSDEAILEAIKHGLTLFPLNAELKACQGIVLARKGLTKKIKNLLEESLHLYRKDEAVWSFYNEIQGQVDKLLERG